MSGPNGLHPVANLAERQKCPLAPTKRRYIDGSEAGREAQKRAKSTGLPSRTTERNTMTVHKQAFDFSALEGTA